MTAPEQNHRESELARERLDERQRSSTSPPPEAGNQATTPPANPDVDEEALRRGRERLEQAGGAH